MDKKKVQDTRQRDIARNLHFARLTLPRDRKQRGEIRTPLVDPNQKKKKRAGLAPAKPESGGGRKGQCGKFHATVTPPSCPYRRPPKNEKGMG